MAINPISTALKWHQIMSINEFIAGIPSRTSPATRDSGYGTLRRVSFSQGASNPLCNDVRKRGLGGHGGQGCQMAKFCAPMPSTLAQSKKRKGSNFAAQLSGAIVQKPKGPGNLKIQLKPSGNHGLPAAIEGWGGMGVYGKLMK